MKNSIKKQNAQGLLGPGADDVFIPLTSPEIKRRVMVAHAVVKFRTTIQKYLSYPIGHYLLHHWMNNRAGSRHIEAWGLSRHNVNEVLGNEALTLYVNPRELTQIVEDDQLTTEKRPSSVKFIWDGDWDQYCENFLLSTRYHFIRELNEHRNQLECTERYKELVTRIKAGDPWKSHQLGVILDTPEKIIHFLHIYLNYFDDMAINGFDATRGKDGLGVAISREGHILKINRGLHRLAIAQQLGIPTVPVQVRHVHKVWWDRVTEGTTGALALEKMQQALALCKPRPLPATVNQESSDVGADA